MFSLFPKKDYLPTDSAESARRAASAPTNPPAAVNNYNRETEKQNISLCVLHRMCIMRQGSYFQC